MSPVSSEKQVPQNEIAEKAVLCALLNGITTPSKLESEGITQDIFHCYKRAFVEVSAFAKNGGGEVLEFVQDAIQKGFIEQIGTAGFVMECAGLYTQDHIQTALSKYLTDLKKCHAQRQIQQASQRLAVDPTNLSALDDMTAAQAALASCTKSAHKTIADFRVDHSDTIGMSWQEIDQLRPPFVVDGFGRRGELMLIAAESKSRKSWLVQDMAFSVALGVPWLRDENGQGGFNTARATVHVFDLELDASEMRFRLAKARGNWTTDIEDQQALTEGIRSYSLDGIQAVDVLAYLDQLKATVQAGDLVVVDCLYRLQADGNETELIASIMQTLKTFAKDTQAMIVLVDHFRKGGAEKSRDRIAGTFVKSASASTIVAIEVDPEKNLAMQIDARTFHGNDRVKCRFDCDTYRFVQVADLYASDETTNECDGWLVDLWRSHDQSEPVTVKGALAKWLSVSTRQGAERRLERLEKLQWIISKRAGKGRSTEFFLTGKGIDRIKHATEPVAPVAPRGHEHAESLNL